MSQHITIEPDGPIERRVLDGSGPDPTDLTYRRQVRCAETGNHFFVHEPALQCKRCSMCGLKVNARRVTKLKVVQPVD